MKTISFVIESKSPAGKQTNCCSSYLIPTNELFCNPERLVDSKFAIQNDDCHCISRKMFCNYLWMFENCLKALWSLRQSFERATPSTYWSHAEQQREMKLGNHFAEMSLWMTSVDALFSFSFNSTALVNGLWWHVLQSDCMDTICFCGLSSFNRIRNNKEKLQNNSQHLQQKLTSFKKFRKNIFPRVGYLLFNVDCI